MLWHFILIANNPAHYCPLLKMYTLPNNLNLKVLSPGVNRTQKSDGEFIKKYVAFIYLFM